MFVADSCPRELTHVLLRTVWLPVLGPSAKKDDALAWVQGQSVWCWLVVYRSGLGIPGGSLWF